MSVEWSSILGHRMFCHQFIKREPERRIYIKVWMDIHSPKIGKKYEEIILT